MRKRRQGGEGEDREGEKRREGREEGEGGREEYKNECPCQEQPKVRILKADSDNWSSQSGKQFYLLQVCP